MTPWTNRQYVDLFPLRRLALGRFTGLNPKRIYLYDQTPATIVCERPFTILRPKMSHQRLCLLTCRGALSKQPFRRTFSSMTCVSTATSAAPTACHPAGSVPRLLPPRQLPPRHRSRALLSRNLSPRVRHSPFSTTTPNRATTVALNPRVDDDGNPMVVEISPRAANVRRICALDETALQTAVAFFPFLSNL